MQIQRTLQLRVEQTHEADPASGVTKRLCTEHIGAKEAGGIVNRKAVVRLGGEVHHRRHLFLREQVLDEVLIRDVAPHEPHLACLFERREGRPIAGIGERVEDHNGVVGMTIRPKADEVGTDEPGSAGDEKAHRPNGSGAQRRCQAHAPRRR